MISATEHQRMNEISESRDQIRGYLAVAAATAGWPEKLAAVVARLAEPVVAARLVDGMPAEEALSRTLSEMSVLMAVEVFSAAIAEGESPMQAFERVDQLKAAAMGDEPGSEAAREAARKTFETSLGMGLTPAAALIAADMLAGAAAALANAQSK